MMVFSLHTFLSINNNNLWVLFQLSCTVDTSIYGEEIISLSSLMQSTAPYRIESSDGHIFLLNVCGPLPRAKNLGCKDGSAACLLQSDTRTTSDTPLV